MKVTFDYFSQNGDRELNEDSIAIAERNGAYCFILCDGLGGHGNGDRASQFVSAYLKNAFLASDTAADFFDNAVNNVNSVLLAEQKKLDAVHSMKTTMTVLVLENDTFRFAYVGDSRIYLFRKNKVAFRTVDHSVPQMLALSGEIRERQIRRHPDRNRLLRAMGVEWDGAICAMSEIEPLQNGDAFLLCSDGLWEPVTEWGMRRSLKKSRSAAEWSQRLQALAVKNGKKMNMDNFSAITVLCEE